MEQNINYNVFIVPAKVTCSQCGKQLGYDASIARAESTGDLCLPCANLDQLVFLKRGDAALTRRARKHSTLSAPVFELNYYKHYEQQGLLVEAQALELAKQECLADADARTRRQEREAVRRSKLDRQYVEQFAARVRELFPRCPPGREVTIAEHACLKSSRRVGRSAAAKNLDEKAIRLAVIAHIRHYETEYDELLEDGWDKLDARARIQEKIEQALTSWQARK